MSNIDTPYYDVLNISPKASDEELREAYKTLAKIYHPDHNPNNRIVAQRRFQRINEAYNHLMSKRTKHVMPRNDNSSGSSWFMQLAESIISSRQQGKSQ